jgi:E3 ubiquitin-protein ligase HECTD1
MRLVDLLLVLLFEGRKALSRSGPGGVSGQLLPRLRRMDSAGEKSHRQLIDCIRSKDTDALIEAIDTGGTCKFDPADMLFPSETEQGIVAGLIY